MTESSSVPRCAEKELVVLCGRTRIEPETAQQIRDLVVGPLDWDFLFTASAENCMLPLVVRHLAAAAADRVPPAELARLKSAARENSIRCLILTAELIKIVDLFRAEGIGAIPYKGPTLAVQAYGDVSLREFEDLDIILRQRDMAKANQIILSLGYRPKFPWILEYGSASTMVPVEYNYRDEGRRMMVELHTEFTLRHFPNSADLDELASRLAPVALGGREILALSAEDSLPILCIHGAKDCWERISWIVDISEFVQSHPQLDWDRVFQHADSLGARRMMHVGLALAAGLLDAPLPQGILSRVRGDRAAMSVAAKLKRAHLSREWPAMNAAARFAYRRRMVRGAFAGWRYAIRLATLPSEDDAAIVRLPRPLAPLYTLLRPLRLLRRYRSAGNRPAERS